MKAKPVSKKAVAPPKKKVASPAKRKAASATKKKPVPSARKKSAPTKGKPISIAKEKLELSNQVMDFAKEAFKGRRIAYFVLGTEKTPDGAYTVCVAIENEAGFYKLDWGWHCSLAKAKAETQQMNDKLGLTEEEVNSIVISTMGTPTYQ